MLVAEKALQQYRGTSFEKPLVSAFKKMAAAKGFTENESLRPDVKAGEIIRWLKDDFELGHGHAMAIVALLKGTKK